MSSSVGFDLYALRARGYPTLLLVLPALVTLGTSFPAALDGVSALIGVAGGSAVLYAGSQMIRQVAKRREIALWRGWGGKPTTVALRWRTADGVGTQPLVRERIARAVPEIDLPSPEVESAHVVQADDIYEAVVTTLREKTRDTRRFPVVFSENVSYGFRRNSWAVRWFGLAIALAAIVGIVAAFRLLPRESVSTLAIWLAGAVDGACAFFWCLIAKPRWVQEAAEAYRDALFAAAAALSD